MNPGDEARLGKDRIRCLVALVAAVFLVLGCDDSSPTGPQPAANPTPPSSLHADWSLTVEVIGDSGPTICLYRPSVGMVFHTTFALVRSGNTITFAMSNPFDWESYTATVNGTSFTATNPTSGSGSGMCVNYLQTTSLSGSFSEDGNQLTATEVWLLTLDSGESVTTTLRWSATRG